MKVQDKYKQLSWEYQIRAWNRISYLIEKYSDQENHAELFERVFDVLSSTDRAKITADIDGFRREQEAAKQRETKPPILFSPCQKGGTT